MRSAPAWKWVMYLGVLVAFGGLLVWATRATLARNPVREATTEVGPFGLITIRFSPTPSPALPTGPVTLSFMPMDARGRPAALDELTFEYGTVGNDHVLGTGEAQRMSDGSGMFMGQVQFPTAGNWWLRVRLYKGAAQGYVQFTLAVKPAQ